MQGETVPYIICVEKDTEGNLAGNQKGLAERAHHPEEVNAAPDLLAVDAEYYLTQQVCPHWHQVTIHPFTLVSHHPCLMVRSSLVCAFSVIKLLAVCSCTCHLCRSFQVGQFEPAGPGRLCLPVS